MDVTLNLTWKENQTSEHVEPNWMPWSIAYKNSTTGDTPVTNGLIEIIQILKQCSKVSESADIPVIHASSTIIVDTNTRVR
jgi:hypothetical protein